MSLFDRIALPTAAPSDVPAGVGASADWQDTRAQTALATQMLEDEDAYLAPEKLDIGRQVGTEEVELFVACAPDEALRQQIDYLHPEFIAVHDIGTESSRKLLAGIAAARGQPMRRLQIRREGRGTPLATLEFVELPTQQGTPLRMYSTDIAAEPGLRQDLAHTLLAHSRLGVVMVGDLAATALAQALQPLRDTLVAGPWPNRQLLLLPLVSAGLLAAQGNDLPRGTDVHVRTTPTVQRPADAWGFIQASWSRLRDHLREQPGGDAVTMPTLAALTGLAGAKPDTADRVQGVAAALTDAAAPGLPQPGMLTLRPMPEIPTAASRAATGEALLDRYLHKLGELAGMVSCALFDVASGQAIAHAGASPGPAELARHGADLLGALGGTSRSLGFGHALPEAAITLGSHHLLLRAVPKHPGMALHAVFDKSHANLTLARLQVQRLDDLFDAPAR